MKKKEKKHGAMSLSLHISCWKPKPARNCGRQVLASKIARWGMNYQYAPLCWLCCQYCWTSVTKHFAVFLYAKPSAIFFSSLENLFCSALSDALPFLPSTNAYQY